MMFLAMRSLLEDLCVSGRRSCRMRAARSLCPTPDGLDRCVIPRQAMLQIKVSATSDRSSEPEGSAAFFSARRGAQSNAAMIGAIDA